MGVEGLFGYLQAAAQAKNAETFSPQPFVTLSRQAGAGSTEVASALARRLSEIEGRPWTVVDRALCEEVAADRNLSVTLDNLMREIYREPIEDYITYLLLKQSSQGAVTKAVFQTLRAAALSGRTVIVGRAGSLVTRDLSLGVHIRLVMPRPQRVSNLERWLGLPAQEAERECARRDADRRQLVKSYFKKEIDDPLLYDAVWNAGRLSAEAIAELTARLVLLRRG
ncbi:MAG: cytidylate kinase-like family protein [Elusimicrobia bacterium]|nr:cytidylate kinase-like family protein [Elusimicrobiota bacterium]MDE2236440.1 cytidylate kinase-like family protein [Elusimicrobiota bacterium]MDE2425171.1 cytidylate kinase-like family protein [Elusimicrobiota bacterium]